MSVPTTLQGTHDGCGGTVVFRPATHRRELLAGRSVMLRAACRSCGATLSIEWAMPNVQSAVEQAERALPMAAGAEEWQYGHPAAASARPASQAPAPQQPEAPRHVDRPVTSLGDWRMRSTPQRHPEPAPAPETTPAPASERPSSIDPYLSAFSTRVESARENLRRMSTDLPSALSDGDAFRAPKLRRGDTTLPPSRLSASTALRPPAAPVAPAAAAPMPVPAAEPVAQPAPQTVAQPAPVAAPEPAVADAIAAAIASPSFHDDHSAPQPAIAAEPVARVAVEPVAAPMPQLEAAPVAEVAPVAEAAPAMGFAPPAHAAPATLGDIAPTDADVFPPAASAPASPELVAPAPPAPAPIAPTMQSAPEPSAIAEQLALPAAVPGDAAANVWGELSAPAPVVPAPAATAPAPAEPSADTPSFAEAFGDAAAAPAYTPQLVAPEPLETSPEAAGAMHDLPDASVAFERDRGFDWGGADAVEDRPKRSFGRRRKAKEDSVDAALVAAGPEIVFEPSDERDEPRGHTSVGYPVLALVVILGVIAALAGSKIVANRNLEPLAAVVPTAGVEIDPAAITSPAPARPAKKPAKKATAAAKPKGAPKARATARKPAAAREQVPVITQPPTTPGAPVADTGGSLADAANAATTEPAAAQVTASAADTAHKADSNPFAP